MLFSYFSLNLFWEKTSKYTLLLLYVSVDFNHFIFLITNLYWAPYMFQIPVYILFFILVRGSIGSVTMPILKMKKLRYRNIK